WGATFIVLILSAVFAIIFTLMSRERSLEFEKE
ncbi:MFS transporter, partial [Shigella sonnei]|nr:MFS transporter [Shigella sonnei]